LTVLGNHDPRELVDHRLILNIPFFSQKYKKRQNPQIYIPC